jgi:hypothetical protein
MHGLNRFSKNKRPANRALLLPRRSRARQTATSALIAGRGELRRIDVAAGWSGVHAMLIVIANLRRSRRNVESVLGTGNFEFVHDFDSNVASAFVTIKRMRPRAAELTFAAFYAAMGCGLNRIDFQESDQWLMMPTTILTTTPIVNVTGLALTKTARAVALKPSITTATTRVIKTGRIQTGKPIWLSPSPVVVIFG